VLRYVKTIDGERLERRKSKHISDHLQKQYVVAGRVEIREKWVKLDWMTKNGFAVNVGNCVSMYEKT